jgi:hypothetical protein
MKTIDLAAAEPTIGELLELADEDPVLIKTSTGREYVLAEVDDFDREVELTRQNAELMAFLDERSRETKTYTLEQVRQHLRRTRRADPST